MAGRRVAARVKVERAPEDVFDWVADYRHVPIVMEGVRRWHPIGSRSEGVGARYQVELGGLLVAIGAKLVITDWNRPHEIAWASESSPVSNQGRWTFKPAGKGTEVELAVRYRPPVGPVGNFLAARVEGVVEARIRSALVRMKERLEAAA